MAKRIYWESVKKWAIKAGIPAGIASFTILFMYLSFLGVIEVTGHSGDMVCAGTESDPCLAYINFSAKEDIFLYPIGYDPWGRDTPFETNRGLKSWEMYRSWGKGWREIKLNETCKGTWCGGKYGLKNNKYSFAFREGRDYQIKIIAYKEDPYEDIKWGFGPVDPIWFGSKDVGKYSSIDSFGQEKILWLNITKIDGFEKYIILDISKESDSRFIIRYKLNEALKTEIDTCNALSLSSKETCFDDVKKDYVDKISKEDFNVSINSLKNYPKENLTSNIKIEGKIDLNSEGDFYVDVLNYDEKDLSKSVGEKFKIGFNTITIEIVESTNDIGKYSSIALDSTGVVHISHYDTTNGELRYCNDSGGSWSCVSIDACDGRDCGKYSSIAINSSDDIHISFWDTGAVRDDLGYCVKAGNAAWVCSTAEECGSVHCGYYTSIAINSSDDIHVSHSNFGTYNTNLRYSVNAAGSWSSINPFLANHGYGHTSIAIDSSDVVHISHRGEDSADLSYCNDSSGSWTCANIDVGADIGTYPSIATDSNNIIHISYYNSTEGNLKYCNNSGGSFSCETVETCGADVCGQFTSIAIDSLDKPYIIHFDDTNDELRYCKLEDTWGCEVVDDSIEGSVYKYDRTIAIKKGRLVDTTSFSDKAHLSYYNDTAGDLMYASIDLITECSPTLDQDWDISDAQVCDGVQVTTGTGNINILSGGNLTLINGANVTTTKLHALITGDQVFINSGCELRMS